MSELQAVLGTRAARVRETTGHPWAAAVVWCTSWVVVAAGLGVAALGGGDPDRLGFDIHPEFFAPDAIIAVIYGPIAAIVLTRSRHPVGWILAAIAVGFALSSFGIQYGVLGADHELPAYALGIQLVAWAWGAGAFAGALVLPWVLQRDRVTGWPRRAAMLGLGMTVFACLTRMLIQLEDAPDNPLASAEVSRLAYAIDGWAIPVYFGYGIAGAVHLALRYRGSGPDERRGLLWVTTSLVLICLSYLSFETGLSLGGPLLAISAVALFAALVMLPAALFVLILRQPQWEFDVAVSRATMWGLLTAAVAAVYLTLVWLGGMVFPEGSGTPAVLGAAVLALAVLPGQQWLQRRVDRLVYGSGADPEELLSRLAADLSGRDPRTAGLEGLVESLRRSMRLRHVAVRSAGAPVVAVDSGEPTATTRTIPLVSHGRQVGSMVVGTRAGERLDPRTVHLLEQIAGLVAVSLELALVNRQLEATRSRVVDVRQEERRLLRRELHDGLGPALAGSSLALAAIANNNRTSLGAEDRRLLEQLGDELTRRAEDVRDMARTLLPPALDDGRLGDALRVLAERFSDARFSVEIDAPDLGDLDTRRQVAVYHVAAEAVFNAYRHADARRCRVRLTRAGRRLALTVTDDGTGLPDAISEGIGITSMKERAAELGGTFEVSHSADGTEVRVVIP